MKDQTKLSAHTVKVLEEVIGSVKKAPPENFDMWDYGGPGCGTAACAWGWWMRDHNRRDIVAKIRKSQRGLVASSISDLGCGYARISFHAFRFLFNPCSYGKDPNQSEVIARIKRFIRTNGKSAEASS